MVFACNLEVGGSTQFRRERTTISDLFRDFEGAAEVSIRLAWEILKMFEVPGKSISGSLSEV